MHRIPDVINEIALAIELLVSAGLSLTCWNIKRRLRALREEAAGMANLRNQVNILKAEVVDLRSRVEGIQEGNPGSSNWSTAAGGIHLNRRGQVLRLHRRGDSIPNIASALGLSNGEVALIVKVQQIRISVSGHEKPRTEL